MALTHNKLIEMVKEAGYGDNENGVCNGYTHVDMLGYFYDFEDKIEATQAYLGRSSIAEFKQKVYQAKQQVRQKITISLEEKEALNGLAYLEWVQLLFLPSRFGVFKQKLTQRSFLHQHELFKQSLPTEQQMQIHEIRVRPWVHSKQSLADYLLSVRWFFKYKPKVYLCIRTCGHILGVTYQQGQWVLRDANTQSGAVKRKFKTADVQLFSQRLINAFSILKNDFPMSISIFYAGFAHGPVITSVLSWQNRLPEPPHLSKADTHNRDLLFYAANHGDAELLGYLVDAGVDVNKTFKLGSTALHQACQEGHLEVVIKAVALGADVNIPDRLKATPLHEACHYGQASIVSVLIGNGANIHAKNTFDETPLLIACNEGHTDVVQQLLGKITQGVHGINHSECIRAFHAACQKEQLSLIALMLDAGVDIDSMDKLDTTALTHAFKDNSLPVVELLLKRGAKPQRLLFNKTYLHQALEEGNLAMARLLLRFGASVVAKSTYKNSPLHIACEKQSVDAVTLLLNYAVDLDAPNQWGKTPLGIACAHQSHAIISLLVAAGANINEVLEDGRSLLMSVIAKGHIATAKGLIALGADTTLRDQFQRCAVHYAMKDRSTDLIAALLEHAAPWDIVDDEQNTLLHHACKAGLPTTVRFLLNKGVSPHQCNKWGQSALDVMIANESIALLYVFMQCGLDIEACDAQGASLLLRCINKKKPRLVEYLLSKGANPWVKDTQGNGALHLACQAGSALLVECFLQRGLGLEEKNKFQQTPLSMACKSGHTRLVERLLLMRINANHQDYFDKSPLIYAVEINNMPLVRVLLRHGVRIGLENYCGKSAWFIACEKGYYSIAKLLLKFGQDCNAKIGADSPAKYCSERGMTALHIAVKVNVHETVSFLIQNGADKEIADANERRAIEYTQENSSVLVKQMLADESPYVFSIMPSISTPLTQFSLLFSSVLACVQPDFDEENSDNQLHI